MDDTKKIIEKYKRELMEMSRASGGAGTAAVRNSEGSSECGTNNTGANSGAPAEKKPQVIGYVSGDSKAYDNFLEELGKMPDETKPADVIVEEAAVEEVVLDERTVEDIPVRTVEANGGQQPSSGDTVKTSGKDPNDVPDKNEEASAVIGLNENGRAVSLDIDAPLFVKGDDGGLDEIIDETVSEGAPLFPQPNYIYIPSTEQVRANVTDDSEPSENRPENNVSGVTDNSTNTPRPERPSKVSVTTEEQAERLGDQPVSGKDPAEQLTGRSFEPEEPPPASDMSMWRGSRGEPSNFPRAEFKDYGDFQKQNPGKGTLIFRVYTGRQAVPLENAECVIYTRINGEKYELAKMHTNSSGQTPVQGLPAPNKALSQQSENKIQAFAPYDAKVTKNGFSQVILEDIPVFDGVMSVQKVFMIVTSS